LQEADVFQVERGPLPLRARLTSRSSPSATTTVVDALAIGLGAIVAHFPKSQGRSFNKCGDIRIPWISQTDLGEKSGVECPFTRITLTASNGLSWDVHKLRSAAHDKLTAPSVAVKALHEALDPALRETLMASNIGPMGLIWQVSTICKAAILVSMPG
jgi:hypothetical protein